MNAVDNPIAEKHTDSLDRFWTQTPEIISTTLHCGLEGLSSSDAERRLAQYGPNSNAETKADSLSRAIFRRLLEPLSLILLAAGIVSVVTGDVIGGSIIVAILALSIGLDTVQEGHAAKTADILRRSVALKAEVKRGGAFHQIEVERVVPGDILRVRAGDIIPADALILQSTACNAGEAALTGERQFVGSSSRSKTR
jgi:Mg2+-importing ATPase